jgi:hypothetical protein
VTSHDNHETLEAELQEVKRRRARMPLGSYETLLAENRKLKERAEEAEEELKWMQQQWEEFSLAEYRARIRELEAALRAVTTSAECISKEMRVIVRRALAEEKD